MTSSERRFRHRLRAVDGRGRFKDRPVLVAFGLLALVLIVFGAGMAAASYQSDAGHAGWRRGEALYHARGW